MRKLFTILLSLALLAPCAAARAEEAPLHFGYIAPIEGEASRWFTLCSDAFSYAAEQQGAEVTVLTYELPEEEDSEENAESDERPQPGFAQLMELIEAGVDGVVLAPATLEQAVSLIDCANAAGVPIVIEGMDVSAAYPLEPEATPAPGATENPEETPDPAELRPYVAAVSYGDSAAYAAAMWLEDAAYNPLLFHCTLPDGDPTIQSGVQRALASARYLGLALALDADADTAQAGREITQAMINSFTTFGCALADSPATAEGCADAIRSAGYDYPVALASNAAEALRLLKGGKIDMVASAPASVEGM